jgi:condensin complex subunit 3
MLSQEELPESLLSKCLDVLRELSNSERDLIRVVVEIVHDLRDPGDDDEEEDPNVRLHGSKLSYFLRSINRKIPMPKPTLVTPQQP